MAKPQSAFTQAVEAFLAEPTRKKRPSFLVAYMAGGKSSTADEVQTFILSLENQHAQKVSRRIIRPVFEVLIDYDSVISTLVSSDPMPSALIWGGLKALLECFKRYNSVLEKVEAQLKKLTFELGRLVSYEKLFKESEDMERLLISSYIHILKFWAAVEEQCLTSSFLLAAKSLTSFKTRRLDDILSDLATSSDNVEKLVPIVQERLRQDEWAETVRERRMTSIALDYLSDTSREEREARRRQEVRQWIQGGHSLNESNDRHQHKHEKALLDGTGHWLHTDENWLRWLDTSSNADVLWLHGDPGVGKSVICAFAARSIRENNLSYAVACQYFSFDEMEPLSIVYRNISEQLFYQLYGSKEEISEHIYEIIQSPGNEATASLKRLITTFVTEMEATYIFLDGFDEEHSVKERWDNVSDVVSFFSDLARQPGSTLKLWCSTQKRGRIGDLMKDAQSLEFSASKNKDDIETFFADALRTRNFMELDPANSAHVLSDLKQQVNGNFLWASLMLDTISDASSLKDLQDAVDEGLPEDFEKYLANRMQRIKRVHHGLLSKVLSCLVYAKRPLLLNELCEAVSLSHIVPGQNLCEADMIHSERIIENCAPWIRVEDLTKRRKSGEKICTLSHGSIRKFLVKYPHVLLRGQNCEITPNFLAEICLSYLEQKRYRKALMRTGENAFYTTGEEDIIDHHLLGYCAKFWSRHLSETLYSSDMCKRVEDFVRSKNFNTVIQIQSLLVEGQFDFQYNEVMGQSNRYLIRVFPRWFTEKYNAGKQLHHDYEVAIGEWGYLLNNISVIKGSYPGEIDRCTWGALPKSNFLRNLPCRYKCFVLESKNAEEFEGLSSLAFDHVETGGLYLNLYWTDNFETDGKKSQLLHEQWSLDHKHRPKLIKADRIPVEMQGLKYYRSALRYPVAGQAAEVSVSDDGWAFRIGHGLFVKAEDGHYKPLDADSIGISYVEEISCNRRFVAAASRRRITEKDLFDPFNETAKSALRQPLITGNVKRYQGGSKSITTTSEMDSNSGNDGDESSDSVSGLNEPSNTAQSVEDSDGVESQFEEDRYFQQLPDDSEDFDDTASSLESLSADEVASDGSQSVLSNEVEDGALWNDYFSDASLANIEDDEHDTDVDLADLADILSERGGLEVAPNSDGVSDAPSIDSGDLSDHLSEGVEAPFNPGLFGLPAQPYFSDDSDEDDLAAETLERLIHTERKVNPTGKVSEISVFKVDLAMQKPRRVFHYSQPAASSIFSSPPVFHPTLDLLVWPLGGESLLFANFTKNRYFTRFLNAGLGASCHISVKCQFSPCGKYLHIVSLDGYINKAGVDKVGLEPKLTMKLHVSTHELSKSKPERSSPRLIYQTSVPLDREIRRDQKLMVPNLPYSFTWTSKFVYVTESTKRLKVIRISLFKCTGSYNQDTSGNKNICKNAEDIFLPASADLRNVRFIPNDLAEDHRSDRDDKKRIVATILLSSFKSGNAERSSSGSDVHLPQIVQINASQFGRGWEPVETKDDNMKALKKIEKLRAGRLLAKFEKFGRSQDYDIIPFLA